MKKLNKLEIKRVLVDSGFNNEYKTYVENLFNPEKVENIAVEFIDMKDYIDSIRNSTAIFTTTGTSTGDIPKLIKKDIKTSGRFDLVLFTGGADVNPNYYGEKKGIHTYINEKRDEEERYVMQHIPNSTPRLGICRGAQFLTVMNGGKLIQHVEGHGTDHEVTLLEKTARNSDEYYFPMSSTHHQMMFPYNLKDHEYQLIGVSRFFVSNVYLNGENEQIKIPSSFLEPEIVFYPKTRSLCIQGHPEYNTCPRSGVMICNKLIKEYLDI